MRAVVVDVVDRSKFAVHNNVTVHTDRPVVNVEDWWSGKPHLLVDRLKKESMKT
jgi:hypothetical protein